MSAPVYLAAGSFMTTSCLPFLFTYRALKLREMLDTARGERYPKRVPKPILFFSWLAIFGGGLGVFHFITIWPDFENLLVFYPEVPQLRNAVFTSIALWFAFLSLLAHFWSTRAGYSSKREMAPHLRKAYIIHRLLLVPVWALWPFSIAFLWGAGLR
ncbi:MAG: hypothetical protein NZ934_00985 [Hadesarchaea archaeon]|nr:hypothetical protein [Hadesarchaea archaeon]